MIEAFLAGAAAGYGIAVPVGAVGVYLVSLGARRGWKVAAGGGLGAAAVDGVYAAAALLAGAAAASVIEPVQVPLRVISALVLAAVGLILLRPAFRPDQAARAKPPGDERSVSAARAFLAVAGLTLTNPTTVIYFTALIAGRAFSAVESVPEQGLFLAGVVGASASWQLLLAGAGASFRRVLLGRRGRRLTALVGGSIVMLLAVKTAAGA